MVWLALSLVAIPKHTALCTHNQMRRDANDVDDDDAGSRAFKHERGANTNTKSPCGNLRTSNELAAYDMNYTYYTIFNVSNICPEVWRLL